MSIGKIVGIVVFVAATAAIWLWPQAEAPEAPEQMVRPVRSIVISGESKLPEMHFAGKVKASASRTLHFKQSGRIERIPLSNGQQVKKGDKLAWLFADDFKNRLENATASAERDRLSYTRIADAAKKNAVSKEELSKAEAQLRTSEANLALAKRALEETVLLAPFDGTVADAPATELDMVSASDPIVILQDMSQIKIEVAVPETIVIMQRKLRSNGEDDCEVEVVFDSCPERKFKARFVEYTAVANANTQTFTASYKMDPVEDLLVLPGMSATIVIPEGSYSFEKSTAESKAIDVPESAVGVDGKGGYFAWKLVQEGKDYVAHRIELKDCTHKGDAILVGSGVQTGDRLATAGVTVLTEGRKVTLLEK